MAAATLRASRRALEVLAVPHTFDALVLATGANAGHVQVALRTLRALGWVTLSDAGAYAAPPATLAAACCEALESLCEAVYSDAPGMVARLAAQLRLADEGWAEFPADDSAPAALRTMLTGAVLAPLLLELHTHHMETASGGGVRLKGLDSATLELLAASFRRRGMCAASLSDGGLQLTESGRFVVQRCGAFGEAVSYRPMLQQLETVLFGDVAEVFTHDGEGHEAHVDRTMNVIASGFMHGKFFDDMMSVHVHHTFDELPLDQQPSIETHHVESTDSLVAPLATTGLLRRSALGLSLSLSRDEPLSVLSTAAMPPPARAKGEDSVSSTRRWRTRGAATVRCCYDSISTCATARCAASTSSSGRC